MNRYHAAWRAECCKADIEMGFFDDDKPLNRKGIDAANHRKEYQRKWYEEHKKAANRLQSEKRRNKKSDTAIIRRRTENVKCL